MLGDPAAGSQQLVAGRGGWRKKGATVSPALPGLCAAAAGLFSAGILWQFVGYLWLEYTNWWAW